VPLRHVLALRSLPVLIGTVPIQGNNPASRGVLFGRLRTHRPASNEGGNPALTRAMAAWPRYLLTSNAGANSGDATDGGGDASPSSDGGDSPSTGGGASPTGDPIHAGDPSRDGGHGPSALLRA